MEKGEYNRGMSLQVGIVGLPNAGKSTLFNALLGKQKALTAQYAFATIDPNKGVVGVPDSRLDRLSNATGIDNKKQAAVTFIDIAGLVKGAAQGEGLGNQFLGQIREVDLICHVLADFEAEGVEKIGKNPLDDYQTVYVELILKDLETVEKALERLGVNQKEEKRILENVYESLDEGVPVREQEERTSEEVEELNLLTIKDEIVVVNVDEDKLGEIEEIERKIGQELGVPTIALAARLEEQVWQLLEEEREEFLQELSILELGLNRLIKVAFGKLGLIIFYTTTSEEEIRAWPVKRGIEAKKAAGVVHTDFEEKFIKARVIDWEEYADWGSWQKAAQEGKVRLVGADYKIEDGQVVEFISGS